MNVVVTLIGSLILLAGVAVVVSQRAQTPAVLKAGGSALGTIIGAAVSPVTGAGGNNFGGAFGGLGALG